MEYYLLMMASAVTAIVAAMSLVIMMVAGCIAVLRQSTCNIRCNYFVSVSVCSGIYFDSRLTHGRYCTATNTAAYHNLCSKVFKESGKRTVSCSVCINHLTGINLAIGNLIDLKLRCPKC